MNKYAFERFVLDVNEFRLTRDGEVVPLPPKPFDLLAALVAKAGQLVSRDELLRTVWKDVSVEQSSLNAAMSLLRQALGADAVFIETVPGRGYRFRGEVRTVDTSAPALSQPPGSRPCRVLIVDDHAVVRLGVRALLGRHPGYDVVGEAASPSEAVSLAGVRRPELIILDLMLDGESALPHIPAFRDAVPNVLVVVLSMHEENQWARRALAAGAQGYVMKGEMLAELMAAVQTVTAGGVWVSARVSRSIVQDLVDGKSPL